MSQKKSNTEHGHLGYLHGPATGRQPVSAGRGGTPGGFGHPLGTDSYLPLYPWHQRASSLSCFPLASGFGLGCPMAASLPKVSVDLKTNSIIQSHVLPFTLLNVAVVRNMSGRVGGTSKFGYRSTSNTLPKVQSVCMSEILETATKLVKIPPLSLFRKEIYIRDASSNRHASNLNQHVSATWAPRFICLTFGIRLSLMSLEV